MENAYFYFIFQTVVVGCGPCGLRTAIEAQLMGAKVGTILSHFLKQIPQI